jgi:hypothetical protein
MSDRYKVSLEGIEFLIAPASYHVKKEISLSNRIVDGNQQFDMGQAQFIYVKNCLKDIKGLKAYDGEDYKLEFEPCGKKLTDDCVSEIFNIPVRDKMMAACWQLLNEVPDKIIHPVTNEEMEGVSLEVISKAGGSS